MDPWIYYSSIRLWFCSQDSGKQELWNIKLCFYFEDIQYVIICVNFCVVLIKKCLLQCLLHNQNSGLIYVLKCRIQGLRRSWELIPAPALNPQSVELWTSTIARLLEYQFSHLWDHDIISSLCVFYDAVNFKILYKLFLSFGAWQKRRKGFIMFSLLLKLML